MMCKRLKNSLVKPSKVLESPTKPPVEKPIVIAMSNIVKLRYLIGRFNILIEDINRKTWFEPPNSDLVFEAIKIGGIINTIQPKTKKEKQLYKIYKKGDKILEGIIKAPPIDPDIVRQKPPPPPEPKPWWHTKVERFDEYGNLISTQYL